jgi:hypothetical protein
MTTGVLCSPQSRHPLIKHDNRAFNKLRLNWSFSLCVDINETKKRQPSKRQRIIICPCDHVYLPTLCKKGSKKVLLGISRLGTSAIRCKRHRVTLSSKPNSKETRAQKKIKIKTYDWMAGEVWKKEVEIGAVIRREVGIEWGAESGWFVEQVSGSAGGRESGGGMMQNPGEMGVAK